jgi:hypothetical protein
LRELPLGQNPDPKTGNFCKTYDRRQACDPAAQNKNVEIDRLDFSRLRLGRLDFSRLRLGRLGFSRHSREVHNLMPESARLA